MANNELQKMKTLLLYDFFLKEVSPTSDVGVTMQGILEYLHDVTGFRFERKSIASDIKRINEYISTMYKVDEWIYLQGRVYLRKQLPNEIVMDEAKMIIDAISAMPFVATNLRKKIEQLTPVYKLNAYKSVHPLDDKNYGTGKAMFRILGTIHSAIEEKLPLELSYGICYNGSIMNQKKSVVSPQLLEWSDNKYYLVAIKNSKLEAKFKESSDSTVEQMAANSLQRYRLDRIASCNFVDKINKYYSCEDENLKDYLSASTKAFSSSGNQTKRIMMTLESNDNSHLLSAFATLTENISCKSILSEKISNDAPYSISFSIDVGLTPTFCAEIFRLSTFNSKDKQLKIKIKDDDNGKELKEMLQAYLKNASSCCKD